MTPIKDPAVECVFASWPEAVRRQALRLRQIILDTAASMEEVGELTETLKWGEPAYLTEASKSGSTVRLGWKAKAPNQYAMYFNCQTDLVETFRTLFPNDYKFEGNRALVFDAGARLPDSVEFCVAAALTYHRRKVAASQS